MPGSTNLLALPPEVLQQVATRLSFRECARLVLVCRQFKAALDSPGFTWEQQLTLHARDYATPHAVCSLMAWLRRRAARIRDVQLYASTRTQWGAVLALLIGSLARLDVIGGCDGEDSAAETEALIDAFLVAHSAVLRQDTVDTVAYLGTRLVSLHLMCVTDLAHVGQLAALTQLTRLHLATAKDLPGVAPSLPPEFASLRCLARLRLSFLTLGAPPLAATLPHVTRLDLTDCQLAETPLDDFCLPSLHVLHALDCRRSEPDLNRQDLLEAWNFLTSVAGSPGLNTLVVHRCHLPALPAGLETLGSLRVLLLSDNSLRTPSTAVLRKLKGLKVLDLSSNPLHARIKQSLDKLSAVRTGLVVHF